MNKPGVIIVDIFKQYDTFREKCIGFPAKFEKKYFSENKLICHPTANGTLISLCSDEEAHSNALCICRMSDMLLMSEDNESWDSFNLMEARKVAEQNGFIYLTDLFAEDAFLSEDWMINGKNDTVIVNEEYMREKGKKYAPVTPLTNKVLHFKKYSNGFFWKPAALGEIICIDKEYIAERFKEFFDECKGSLPNLSASETINFKLFDGDIAIDVNTTRAIAIDTFFAKINEIIAAFNENSEVLDIVGYDFSAFDFIMDLAVAALNFNNIEISRNEFVSKYYSAVSEGGASDKLSALSVRCDDEAIDCIKLAFVNAIVAEYADDIQYSAGDGFSYDEKLRQIELGSYSDDEEKYLISELLSHKPGDFRIFYYAAKKYPDEAENLSALADFWKVTPISNQAVEDVIFSAYILDKHFDEQGRFCANYEESCILKEQLEKVVERYSIANREYINDLEQHIEALDIQRRTFNGTLFSTPEEMKLAVKNEAYIQDLCVDLSALNESELNALGEHIENTTLDDNTKSKYMLKVKLALNNVRTAMLDQRCLKLPVMTLDEISALKDDLNNDDYPEAVLKPFISRIKDAFVSAQNSEIEAMLDKSEDMSDEQLDSVSEKLGSGRYESTIADHFKRKIESIKETNVRARLDKLVDGFESFSKEKLSELIEKLSGNDFPKHMTYAVVKKLTDTLNNYELNEAAKAFDGVDFASAEQLEEMKKIISDKLFSDDILAPYIAKVEQREKDIRDEQLVDMCSGIDTMSQEELDELKEKICDPENNFDEALVGKYTDKIAQRVCELKNSELAELCKYIFSMEQGELDELKEKLSDEKYDPELTAVYFRKIDEREVELVKLELDKLCETVNEKDIEQLEELKSQIFDNEKYADICDSYIVLINNRIDAIKIAEYRKLIESVAEMSAEEVAKFRSDADEKREEIGEELYSRSIEAADARDDQLETEEIEALCEGIEEYDFEKAESVKAQLVEGGYAEEKISDYIKRIDERIYDLHKAELESYVEGIDSMDKEQLIQAQIKVQDYDNSCPYELREQYNKMVDAALAELADREIRGLCGNIESLTARKSSDLIRKITNMPLDEDTKNRYIDVLDAHIASLKDVEAKEYIKYLTAKMSEFGVNAVHLCVPGMSNLFHAKYETVCNTYISAGRYELPILIHEGTAGDSFTLTTEYLYTFSRGVVNRTKIGDIASFQAKKSLMAATLTAVERNGNSNEIPNALNKNIVENVAKVLTALVSFVHDQRSAEQMKELLENAVQEKAAMQQTVPAAAPVEPVAPAVHEAPAAEDTSEAVEVKAKFCDQCGAKITSANAKFCAECGNKLV